MMRGSTRGVNHEARVDVGAACSNTTPDGIFVTINYFYGLFIRVPFEIPLMILKESPCFQLWDLDGVRKRSWCCGLLNHCDLLPLWGFWQKNSLVKIFQQHMPKDIGITRRVDFLVAPIEAGKK